MSIFFHHRTSNPLAIVARSFVIVARSFVVACLCLLVSQISETRASGAQRSVTIAPDAPQPGGWLQLDADGFPPRMRVEVGLGPVDSEYSVAKRPRTDARGSLRTRVRVPLHAPTGGEWVAVVAFRRGERLDKTVSNVFRITSRDESSRGERDDVDDGAAVEAFDFYVVRSGDTLYGVAQSFDASVSAIVAANPSIENPDVIRAGQRIRIPARDGFGGATGVTERRGEASGVATLTNVRTSTRSDHDRIVFEFDKNVLPGYRIEYVDRPVRQCGSGRAVEVRGDARLQISFTPAKAHTEAGRPTVKDRERKLNHRVLREAEIICDFEAEVSWVVGVTSPNRYRVKELKNPARIVIDVSRR